MTQNKTKKQIKELTDMFIDDDGKINIATATDRILSHATYNKTQGGIEAYLKAEKYGFIRPTDRIFLRDYSHNPVVRELCRDYLNNKQHSTIEYKKR